MALALIRRWATQLAPMLAEQLERFERSVDSELRSVELRKVELVPLDETLADQTYVQPGQVARVNTSTGNRTLLLPPPRAEHRGKLAGVAKVAATNTLTVKPASGTINGASSLALTSVGLSLILCDGQNYWSVS